MQVLENLVGDEDPECLAVEYLRDYVANCIYDILVKSIKSDGIHNPEIKYVWGTFITEEAV